MFRLNPTAGYYGYQPDISRISAGYQPDIEAFCTPDIKSCYPLEKVKREPDETLNNNNEVLNCQISIKVVN